VEGVPIVFPGNSQGRNIRETGPKGCEIVMVDDDGMITSRFEALDVVRWLDEAINVTGALNMEDVDRAVLRSLNAARQAHPDRLLAIRVRFTGATALTPEFSRRDVVRDRLNSLALDVGDIWVERIVVETSPTEAASALPLADEVRELVVNISADDVLTRQLMDEFAVLRGNFIGDLEQCDAAAPLLQFKAFRAMVERAAGVCLAGEYR
jgi:exonuclease SbcD